MRSQVRYSTLGVLRDPMSVFFAVAFPVLLLVFFSAIYGDEASWGGMPLPQYLAAAFSVYGVAVMSYVNISGGGGRRSVAQDPEATEGHPAASVGLHRRTRRRRPRCWAS